MSDGFGRNRVRGTKEGRRVEWEREDSMTRLQCSRTVKVEPLCGSDSSMIVNSRNSSARIWTALDQYSCKKEKKRDRLMLLHHICMHSRSYSCLPFLLLPSPSFPFSSPSISSTTYFGCPIVGLREKFEDPCLLLSTPMPFAERYKINNIEEGKKKE